MSDFDLSIIHFLNQFARHSFAFDAVIRALSVNHLFKGGVLVMLLWWAWFYPDPNKSDSNRKLILATMVSCVIAESMARILSHTLPFRIRPLYETGLDFVLPFTLDPDVMKLSHESSFPSDHAVLFYSLSASLWLISKRVGIFALAYTTVMIAFPRVYLGLHYPTDIIGGAALGGAVTLAMPRWLSGREWMNTLLRWSNEKPHWFTPFFFIVMYQIVEMFDESRAIIGGFAKLLRIYSGA
jgi:undecaprenyl-diphosphatase